MSVTDRLPQAVSVAIVATGLVIVLSSPARAAERRKLSDVIFAGNDSNVAETPSSAPRAAVGVVAEAAVVAVVAAAVVAPVVAVAPVVGAGGGGWAQVPERCWRRSRWWRRCGCGRSQVLEPAVALVQVRAVLARSGGGRARVRAVQAPEPVAVRVRVRAVQAPEPAVVPGPVRVQAAPLAGLEPVEALERAAAVQADLVPAQEPAAVPAALVRVVRPRAVVLA